MLLLWLSTKAFYLHFIESCCIIQEGIANALGPLCPWFFFQSVNWSTSRGTLVVVILLSLLRQMAAQKKL